MEGETPSQVTLVIAPSGPNAKFVTVRKLRTNNAMDVPVKTFYGKTNRLKRNTRAL
jgi:hypothetical protein